MSKEHAKAFHEKTKKDHEIQKELHDRTKSPSEIGKKHGYDFSNDELDEVRREQEQAVSPAEATWSSTT